MNDTHICTRGKVWDLHIHSNQCYSTTDEELLNSYLKCAFCAFSLGKKRFTSRIPSDTIVPAAFGRGEVERMPRSKNGQLTQGDRMAIEQ